jgi:hypothetical protein
MLYDHGQVGGSRHRLEVGHDPPLGRLVVVRRDDEDAVDAERVRLRGQVRRVRRVVGPGAGDHGRTLADLVERRLEQRQALRVRERRRLARRAGHDETVRSLVDEMARERAECPQVDRPLRRERRGDRGQHLAQHAIDPNGPSAMWDDGGSRLRSKGAIR